MIHFTSIVAPYAQLAMCFVCANFFLLGMRFTLVKKKKKVVINYIPSSYIPSYIPSRKIMGFGNVM